MASCFSECLARVRAINVNGSGQTPHRSQLILMREFLRRLGEIRSMHAECAGRSQFDAVPWSCMSADLKDQIFEIVDDLFPEVQDYRPFSAMETSLFALAWAALIDQREAVCLDLPELYDPLLRLHERGGMYNFRKGELDVPGVAVWPRSAYESIEWMRAIPRQDIRDVVLDKIDRGEVAAE